MSRGVAELVRSQISGAAVARRVFVEESSGWGPGGADANVVRVLRDDPHGWTAWGVKLWACATRDEAMPDGVGPDCVHVRLAPRSEVRAAIAARVGEREASGPTLSRMNVCFQVRPGLNQILVDKERWSGGPDMSGVALPDYRAYVLHHEFGHALGLWSHTSPDRMRFARRAVPELADTTPDARGMLPASIMMQQSKTVPSGFRFCPRVGLYDAFSLARVAVLGDAAVF